MATIHHPTRQTPAPTRAPRPDLDQVPPPSRRGGHERRSKKGLVAASLAALAVAGALFAGKFLTNNNEAPAPGSPGSGPGNSPEAKKLPGNPVMVHEATENEENSPYRQIIGNEAKADAVGKAIGVSGDAILTSGVSDYEGPKSFGDEEFGNMWKATWQAPDGTTITFFTYDAKDIPALEMARIPGARGEGARTEIEQLNREAANRGVNGVKIGSPYREFELAGADGAYVDPTHNVDSAGSLVFYAGDNNEWVVQATIRDPQNKPLADEGQRLMTLFQELAAASQ